MIKKLGFLTAASSAFLLFSGCISVVEGDKVFTVTGQKFIIGASIQDVEAKVPEGATITTVMVAKGPILGLMQTASISGTK
jgi:hypothetical protein